MCLVILIAATVLSVTPMVLENAAPVDLPQKVSVPRSGAAGMNAEDTQAFASIDALRGYRYMRNVGRDEGAVLWNPNEYAGVPFLAAWHTRAISPFSLPFYIFDLRTAFILSAFAKVLVAGLLAFYVARVLGLAHAFAALVGAAHGLSAALLVWTIDPAADAAPWIPLLFLFAERLSLGQVRYWPSGALVIGLLLFSGAVQALASALVFFALYAFLRRPGREATSALAVSFSAVAAALLGLALGAIQLVPYAEWFQESVRVWIPREASLGLRALVSIIVPLDVAAEPAAERAAAMLHVGLVPIFLGGLWIALRPYVPQAHRRRVDAILLVGWSWVGAGVLLALLQRYVGPLQYVLLHEVLAPCGFAVALGAAAAGEAWLELRPEQSLATVRRYAVLLGGLVVGAGLCYGAAYGFFDVPDDVLIRALVVGGLVVLTVVFVLAVTLVRPWARFMGYTLTLATALQLLLFLTPLQPRTPWDTIHAAEDVIPADASGERLAIGPTANAAIAVRANQPLLRGYGRRMPRRMAPFLARAADEPELLPRAGAEAYLLSGDDLCGAYASMRPALRLQAVAQGDTARFAYLRRAERARIVHELQSADRFDAGLLSPDEPPVVEADIALSAPKGWLGRALLDDPFSPTRYAVNVYRTDPGMLVVADTYYPGWQARVDGAPARIYAVDHAFRGVLVPNGAREVEFRYAPLTFQWARIISLGSLSICLFGLAHLIYFRFRNQYFRM